MGISLEKNNSEPQTEELETDKFPYKLNLHNLCELIGDSSPSIGNVGPLPLSKKKAHRAQ